MGTAKGTRRIAKAEIGNGHPHLNAQAVISMKSALDALAEEWVPAMRQIPVQWLIDDAFRRSDELHPEAAQHITPEIRDHLEEALRATAAAQPEAA